MTLLDPRISSEVVGLLLIPLQFLKNVFLALAGRGVELPLGIELAIVTGVVILFLALQRALRREQQLARTDPLTGLANRRYFCERATHELSRAKRSRRPFTIAYLDLDNFKDINDRWGHAAGDIVLKIIAQCLQRSLRPMDCVARLGGDEFAILLPETGPLDARKALEHVFDSVSKSIQKTRWALTHSVGVVSFLDTPQSMELALRHVDALMYGVKKNGKNAIRVGIWRRSASSHQESKMKELSIARHPALRVQ